MPFSSRFRLLLPGLAAALLAQTASAQTAVDVTGSYDSLQIAGINNPATSNYLFTVYLDLLDYASLTSRGHFEPFYLTVGSSCSLALGNVANSLTDAHVFGYFYVFGDDNQLAVGLRTSLEVYDWLVMGSHNTLTVSSGATSTTFSTVQNNHFYLGCDGGNSGGKDNHLTVTGAYASWWTINEFQIGAAPGSTGNTVTVQNGAKLRADQGIFLAPELGSGGTLNIGAQDLNQATTGGTVNTTSVVFGVGAGAINFNQTDTTSFSAPIVGYGTVTQRGSGTTTLSGNNSYTGATIIESGTLVAGSNTAFGGSTVSVHGGKLDVGGFSLGNTVTLDGGTLAGTGTLTGAVSMGAGSTLAPGNSPGTLTFTNGLTLAAGSILDFQLGTISDLINVTGGALTGPASGQVYLNISDSGGFGAKTYILFDFTGATLSGFDLTDFTVGSTPAGYTYSLAFSGSTLELTATAIPEPATYAALAGLGALGLAAARRRSRAAA